MAGIGTAITLGGRLGKVPMMAYGWLVQFSLLTGMFFLNMPIPTWYAVMHVFSTGAFFVTVAIQSSGGTLVNPEQTEEMRVVLASIKVMQETVASIQVCIPEIVQIQTDLTKLAQQLVMER